MMIEANQKFSFAKLANMKPDKPKDTIELNHRIAAQTNSTRCFPQKNMCGDDDDDSIFLR